MICNLKEPLILLHTEGNVRIIFLAGIRNKELSLDYKWLQAKNCNYIDRHGFDQYLGIPYSHDMCPCLKCFGANVSNKSESCFDSCRPDSVGCPLFLNEEIIEQPTDLPHLTEKYTQAALKFVTSSVEKHKKPFFLYMAYHQTHHPQFASEKIL